MRAEAEKGHLGALLAFTRLSFNYFVSEAAFAYVVEAVHLLAREGWKLLPLYRFDPESGHWQHRAEIACAQTSLREALQRMPARLATAPESVLDAQLDAARQIMARVQAHPPRAVAADPVVSDDFQRIRWFPLPGEALAQLHSGHDAHVSSAGADRTRSPSSRRAKRAVAPIGASIAWP